MSLTTEIIDALIASGVTAEQLGAAVKAALASEEAAKEAKRAKDAESKSLRPKERVWLVLRAEVFQRDGHRCVYCGDTSGPFQCDHVVPVSLGGSNDIGNLVTACSKCNASKGAKPLEVWLGARGE